MADDVLTDEARPRATPPPLWRRPLVLAAVGAAAAAAVVITIVAMDNGDDSAPLATTVTYDLAAGDIMQSCIQLSEFEPAPEAEALAGTVVSVDEEHVVLDVDHWYTGGDADRVQLDAIDQNISLDGVEFVVGDRYLVSAADGVVMVCGVSGPATSELEQFYDEWYG